MPSSRRVRLQVRESVSGYLLEWLLSGQLDIGMLYNVAPLNTISIEPLLSDELLLIGPSDAALFDIPMAPIGFHDILALPLIVAPRPHGLRTLVEDAARARSQALSIVLEVDAMTRILDLVQDGQGYSVAPYAAVHRRIAQGLLKARPIVDPCLPGVVSIAFSPKKEITLAMKALYRIVRQETDALVRDGVWRTQA